MENSKLTISGIEDNTSGTTRGVEGEDGLDSDVHGRGVEGFEHDLSHLFSVSLGVQGGFGEENRVFFGGNTKFVVEGVMPDLLHVIPVGDDTVLNGVLQGEDTSLALGFVSDVGVLLSHTNHDTLMTGTSDDGGEHGTGSIVSGETGLAHTGSIVDDKGSNIFVAHYRNIRPEKFS